MANIEVLRKQRKGIKGVITHIHNYCVKNEGSVEDFLARSAKIEEKFKEFENVQNDIENLDMTSEQAAIEEKIREEIEEKYFYVKSMCIRLKTTNELDTTVNNITEQNNADSQGHITNTLETLSRSQAALHEVLARMTSTPITTHAEQTSQQINLPRINLPTFDGTYTQWLHFRDLFIALIHDRNNISNIEKFEYLQSHVRGEALSIIKHLTPSNENYTVAWNLLKHKYDNSEHLIKGYMQLLFDQPTIKTASVIEIKGFLNKINECINALKALQQRVEHWDAILIFHLERKLGSESRSLWCRERSADKFEQFMEFLNNRARELELCQNNVEYNKQTQKRSYANKQVYTSTIKTCPLCQQIHFVYLCEKFKALSVEERVNLVKNNSICYSCLHYDHSVANCKGSRCRKCNGKHNTLLHRDYKRNNSIQTRSNSLIESSEPNSNINSVNFASTTKLTILPTAVISILSANGILSNSHSLKNILP